MAQIIAFRVSQQPRKKWMEFDERALATFASQEFHTEIRRRKDRPTTWREESLDEKGYEATPAPPSSDPDAPLVGDELAERIDREVARWTDAQRIPWLLRQERWPRADIAEKLGISISTVDSHLVTSSAGTRRSTIA